MTHGMLWILPPIYALAAFGLDGVVGALVNAPDSCAGLTGWVLGSWMTGTFMAHLVLGFVSRHILLLWLAPGCSMLSPVGVRHAFGRIDGACVAGLIAVTAFIPRFVIYFSAAPLIPVASAFALTWIVRRGLGERLEWKHLLFGFEIALMMWLGAIHAGSLALRCSG